MHRGFEALARGRFDNGGDNLYVNARGVVETIHRFGLNNDGHVDIILPNSHGYIERDPTWIYTQAEGEGKDWPRRELPNDSGWMSRVLDVDGDGQPDLVVPAYSTAFSRELPAFIYWGDGESFDFDHPFVIPCDSSCAFMAVDITGNGYLDVLAVCHRTDLGHEVDSLLFWNGPEGLSFDRVTHLPGLGPHRAASRDFGNGRTREPVERYVSPPYALREKRPVRLSWRADVPNETHLSFELRWGQSEQDLETAQWQGPAGVGTSYDRPDAPVRGVPDTAALLQYRANFVSENGCLSPKLHEVTVALGDRDG